MSLSRIQGLHVRCQSARFASSCGPTHPRWMPLVEIPKPTAILRIHMVSPTWSFTSISKTRGLLGGVLIQLAPVEDRRGGKSIQFGLRVEECAEILEMDLEHRAVFDRVLQTPNGVQTTRKSMTWMLSADDPRSVTVTAVLTQLSDGTTGNNLALLLSPAEFTIVKLLLKHAIPHVLGFDAL